MRQYTDEYLDNIHRRSRKPCLPTSKSGSTPFDAGAYGRYRLSKKPGWLSVLDFFGGNTLKADVSISVTELGRCSTTPGHTWKRKSTSRGLWRGTELYRYQRNIDVEQNCGMYAAPSGSTLLIDRNCHKSLRIC